MVLGTNIYLHLPVNTDTGRRFLVLLEPMLSPGQTNARIYSSDYVVVVSPTPLPAANVPMDLIRHTYLHFVIEPLVYARAGAMDRMMPLLKPVQDAPLEFIYKSDIAALLNECLIKAVEAHTMDVGIAVPAKPDAMKDRCKRWIATSGNPGRCTSARRRQCGARPWTWICGKAGCWSSTSTTN